MKKRIVLLGAAVLAVLFIVAGCSSQPAAAGAASSGGRIVIYTSMYQNVIDALKPVLDNQFPGVEIQFVQGGTGRIQARVAEEEAAGSLLCDMLLVADPSYAIELKGKGMLHSYISPSAASLDFDYDREGYWYPVRISNMVLAFNPALTPRDSVPNSFQGFANDSSLRNTIAMGTPNTSGTVLATVSAIRDKYGDDYFAALGRQNIKVDSGGAALSRLESGEYKMIMILEESVLPRKKQGSSRLEIIYPSDGTVMIPSPIMTIADEWSANHNTQTAEKITEWFLSPDGQNAIVDGWMHSVMKDFPRLPEGAIPTADIRATSMPVNWENTFRLRNDIQYKFDEALAARDPQ